MTRKKHGIPSQPFSFFRELWSSLKSRNLITLLLARYRDRFIAGIILCWFKDIAYYKFSASDDKFLNLRANQLLIWTAIRLAQQHSCKIFNFVNEGLSKYKSRWGAQETSLSYLQIPNGKKSETLTESSRKHAFIRKMLSMMPLSIIRLTGKLLYNHLA